MTTKDEPTLEKLEEKLREGASDENELALRRVMVTVGQGVFRELLREYPEIAATDLDRIKMAATAAAQDIRVLQEFFPSVRIETDVPRWGVRITRVSALAGTPPTVLGSFGAPRRIEDCINTDEVVMSSTIYGLTTNHLQRAILYLHGYRLTWLGGEKPKVEA